jgi:hypothetical protein
MEGFFHYFEIQETRIQCCWPHWVYWCWREGEGKTLAGDKFSLLVPIWCIRKTLILLTTKGGRRSKRINQRLIKQPHFKRKNKGNYYVWGNLGHWAVSARTANGSRARSLQTWLLVKLNEEHLGMVIFYLLFFSSSFIRVLGWYSC